MEAVAGAVRSVDATYRHSEAEGSEALVKGALRRTRRLQVFSFASPCLWRHVVVAVASFCQGAMSVEKKRCIYSRHDISSLPRVSKVSTDGRDKGNRTARHTQDRDRGKIRRALLHTPIACQLLPAIRALQHRRRSGASVSKHSLADAFKLKWSSALVLTG